MHTSYMYMYMDTIQKTEDRNPLPACALCCLSHVPQSSMQSCSHAACSMPCMMHAGQVSYIFTFHIDLDLVF